MERAQNRNKVLSKPWWPIEPMPIYGVCEQNKWYSSTLDKMPVCQICVHQLNRYPFNTRIKWVKSCKESFPRTESQILSLSAIECLLFSHRHSAEWDVKGKSLWQADVMWYWIWWQSLWSIDFQGSFVVFSVKLSFQISAVFGFTYPGGKTWQWERVQKCDTCSSLQIKVTEMSSQAN